MSNRFNIENLKTYTNQEFQALDDAYFKPSNQVWINIHKEIKKEKNNRNGFLLLIGSSIIVLSLLTLTLYKDNPKDETNQLITISENQFEKVKIKQESKDSSKNITQNFNHQQDIHPKIKSFNKIAVKFAAIYQDSHIVLLLIYHEPKSRPEGLPNAFVHRAAVKRQHKATAVVVEQDR